MGGEFRYSSVVGEFEEIEHSEPGVALEEDDEAEEVR